jgi:hypothetical protein
MRDTTSIGNRTLGIVLSALLHAGYPPLLPFGDGHRYDVAFDRDGRLCRVQCKTGRLEDGAVVFKTASYTRNVPKAYRGEVDYFGVYCPETGQAYLVPVEVVGDRTGQLRVEEPKNGQIQKIHWARDYVL